MNESPVGDLRERLEKCRVLPVIRGRDGARVEVVVETLVLAGITAVELTLTTPDALALTRRIRSSSNVLVGMGSVLSIDAAMAAVHAGAQFLVGPIRIPELGEPRTGLGVPVVHAGLTPTELERADRDSTSIVKMFPASTVSPGYLREVLAPMPHLRVMPSGGVSIASIPEWFAAGAALVSLGGSLLGDSLDGGNLDSLSQRARHALVASRR